MEAAPSPVGVAAASPTPPQWPAESRWIEPPNDLSVRLPSEPAPAWSRPAQGAAGLLLLLALALLGWHAWSAQRGRCRPATLEADAFLSMSLDLNQADHAQLVQLPGVGENLARRIEAYRVEHHGFRAVDELRQVAGIGPKLLEKVRPYVYVDAFDRDDKDEPAMEQVPAIPNKDVKEIKPAVPGKKELLIESIDVNHATAQELRRLPGIGPTLSQRIIETRTKQLFRSVDDLRRVRGIGAKTLERLRPHVVIVER
jgi:competence protein ComEA